MSVNVKSGEFYLLLLVSSLSLAANLPQETIGEYIDQKLLLIVLAAVIVIALIRYLRILLFLCVTALAIGANLPERLSGPLGVSTDIMLAFLVMLVLIAVLHKLVRRFLKLPLAEEAVDVPKVDNEETRKAVLIAVSIGNVKRLRWLIAHNMEINFSENGVAPVLIAAEKGNSEIMQLLIYHGVDLYVTNPKGQTPLEVALERGFNRTAELIRVSLDHGAPLAGETIPEPIDPAGQGAFAQT